MSDDETIEALDNDVLVLARELRDSKAEVDRLVESIADMFGRNPRWKLTGEEVATMIRGYAASWRLARSEASK